jgi:hypothetical protein
MHGRQDVAAGLRKIAGKSMFIYSPGRTLSALLLAAAISVPAQADELKLSIHDGRVTLIAENVPVRRILAEWARIGRSTVVNAEKLTGPPVTLHIIDMPERQALDILLRSAAGFVVAPRPVALANTSQYDRILILAQSRPPAAAPAAMVPQPAPQAFPQQPDPAVGINAVEDHDEPDEAGWMQQPDMAQPFGQPQLQQYPGAPQMAPREVEPGAFVPPEFDPQQQGMPPAFPQPFPGAPADPNQPQPVMLSPTPGVVLTPPTPPGARNPYGLPIRPPQPPPDHEPDHD